MKTEFPALTETEIATAAINYGACLNLEPHSRVLIVTDQLQETTDVLDPNMAARLALTSRLEKQLLDENHHATTIRFDSNTSREEMHAKSLQALQELSAIQTDNDKPLTVVYLGDAWSNRPGLYKAVDDYGLTRFAGSLGFSTGDARVMSQIGPEQLRRINETNEYFDSFFKQHPDGQFEINTLGPDGAEHKLYLNYDTAKAPFGVDMGQVGEGYGVKIGNRLYSNIPGGEQFAAPFPYDKTSGSFSAEGVTFKVKKGTISSVSIPKTVDTSHFAQNQKDLIEAINGGAKIPVSELGLGFYALAGIKTYPDSSTLSLEKGGPHIGFGHNVSPTPEESTFGELAGQFHHGDMVLDHPVIRHLDTQTQAPTRFYPPAN